MPNNEMVDIAVVWKYDTANKKQLALKVIKNVSDREQDDLERMFPEPEYEVQVFGTSDPEGFNEAEEGKEYPLGFDSFDSPTGD